MIRNLLLLIITFAATLSYGQGGRLYTSNELGNSALTCIGQDADGMIFLGSEFGLIKFDGYRFTTYNSIKGDSTSLADNDISTIFTDSQRRLWIGTGHGVSQYIYGKNKFRNYLFPDDNSRPRINTIAEDNNGNIIFGSAGYGLFVLKKGTANIERTPALIDGKRSVAHVQKLFFDKNHDLWICTHENIIVRVKGSLDKPSQVNFISLPFGPAKDLLKADGNGFLLACHNGIVRYDYRSQRFSNAGYDFSQMNNNIAIRKAITTNDGNILLGTASNGLWTIPAGTRKVTRMGDVIAQSFLSSASITNLMESRNHSIWLCCHSKGLYCLPKKEDHVFSSHIFSDHNIVLGSGTVSMTDGKGGDKFVAAKSGVYRFTANGEVHRCPNSPDGIVSILGDGKGNLWLGRESSLYFYNPTTGEGRKMLQLNGWGSFCIADNGKGEIYVSDDGNGFVILNTTTGEIERISMTDKQRKGGTVNNNWVRSMLIDKRGLLWIGTASGISCMDTRSHRFNNIDKNDILNSVLVVSMAERSNGNILLGTYLGLYEYDRRTNNISQTIDLGAYATMPIRSIAIDRHQNLWLGTPRGLVFYDVKKRSTQAFVGSMGMEDSEFIVTPSIQDARGEISMATTGGVISFDPDRVISNKIKLGKVWLTNLLANGEFHPDEDGKYNLDYDENNITMEFSMLDYRYLENIVYQFSLDGGKNWTSLEEGKNAISLAKLAPGSYNFEVRAMCNGVLSKENCHVHIYIASPWYASTIAYFIYTLLLGLIGWYIFTVYKRRQRAEIDEVKMQFLINATHDIRSPLTLIMGPINKLKQRITDGESRTDIETIDRNANRLLMLVNQILDVRKIDKKQMKLNCEETELSRYLNGICSMFQYHARERDITLRFNYIGEGVNVWIDRLNFDKVVSNLLTNAFKYTPDGGSIDVALYATDTMAIIKVKDSGIGFDANDDLSQLFERFSQGKNSRRIAATGSGIGLNLCRSIVEMHGGNIIAKNRDDGKQGAEFVVNIPLGKAHLSPEQIVEENHKDSQATTQKANSNNRVLVVDDDIEIRQYIVGELSRYYKIDTCANGQEAMVKLNGKHYDLIISDVVMPVVDGIALLKNVKTNPVTIDIPVILLTSKAEVADRLEGIRTGADAFIAKPFSIVELHTVADNLISNVRRLRGKFSGQLEQEERIAKVEVKGNDDALMDRIMKSINAHMSEPEYNIESLTVDVGISRAQLHRKIKEITGVASGEFLRNIRLKQAAQLLAEGKVNVSQVCDAVGFVNASHFSSLFKKYYGMSPKEYCELNTTE